jgi:hypothetical protein
MYDALRFSSATRLLAVALSLFHTIKQLEQDRTNDYINCLVVSIAISV